MKKTALIVEDDANDLLFLTNALDGAYLLMVASSLASALNVLQHAKPDVVLLDLELPDSHFPETLERVHPARGAAAIVIVSANGDAAFVRHCLAAGANGYLFKNRLAYVDVSAEIEKAIRQQYDEITQQKALAVARNKASGLTDAN